MSKSNTFENDWLQLVFNATTIANIAINATASPLTNLYVSLHTSDPGEAGIQTTNECGYTSYARVAVARTSGGWTITGNSVSPAADIVFPTCTGGTETATHAAIGTVTTGGGGKILYSGSISPTISISSGTVPRLTTAGTITED